MAFDYTNWKARVGKILGGLNEVNTYRGTTLAGRVTDLLAEYPTSDEALNPAIEGVYTAQDSAETALNDWVSYLSALLFDTTVLQLKADRTIVDESLEGVIGELARRMGVDSQTFADCPSTVTNASVGSPTGDHQFVWARHEGLTGQISNFMVPDVYLMQLSADRSTGGTRWAETFSVVGKAADDLPTDSTYPSGTGINTTATAVDPITDFGLVTDGSFEEWDESNNNLPEQWTIATGTAGTTVFRVTNDPRDGTAGDFALRLLGTGAVLHKITQELTQAEANAVYNAHFRVYDAADPGTDWAVTLSLVDSTGTAIAGPNSYSNVITSAGAGSLATSWANPVTGTFVLPAVLPLLGVFLEIRLHQSGALTTAAANGADAYIDMVSVQPATPLYAGGPALTIFSGITEGVKGDARTATVALSAGVVSTYVIRGLDRLLGLAALTARLPVNTAGGETIADAIIS